MFKKILGVIIIASGVMMFVNLAVVYAPTMFSATVIKHLTVVGRIAAAAVLISFGGMVYTQGKTK